MSYIPCRECSKPVIFESQRAYEQSGCNTNSGSVVFCSKHGGKDEYQDPAESMYRESLHYDATQAQAEISKHDHMRLTDKINKMEAAIKDALSLSELFEPDIDGNPPFTPSMSLALNEALEL